MPGIPTPKDVLGYHAGAPRKLTYYADLLKYYRALAAATPRVKVETIGKSDEDRELVVVWVSSEQNIKNLQQNRDNLARLADPRGVPETTIKQLLSTTKPHYHLMGGLHSSETGPPEMLMELVYRLAVETSPYISNIRDNVYVSVTPVADADGRDRNVNQFYCTQDLQAEAALAAPAPAPRRAPQVSPLRRGRAERRGAGPRQTPPRRPPGRTRLCGHKPARGGPRWSWRRRNTCSLPYWGKYVYHDNNRDINLSQVSMRAITDWYYTAHPPIMHDLHESLSLMYTYSGGPPQNPNLDPILFAELPFFSNWELSQMTKWGMPGVYTHGFMDGWSPGYLGSVAYNHNGMMRMYETQSGRDSGPGPAAAGGGAGAAGGRGAGRGGRGGDAAAGGDTAAGRGCRRGRRAARREQAAVLVSPAAAARALALARRRRRDALALLAVHLAAGADRPCRQVAAAARTASGIAAFPSHPTRPRPSRAATTRITCRPACCPGCSSRRCSRISCSRTSTRRRRTRSIRDASRRRSAT